MLKYSSYGPGRVCSHQREKIIGNHELQLCKECHENKQLPQFIPHSQQIARICVCHECTGSQYMAHASRVSSAHWCAWQYNRTKEHRTQRLQHAVSAHEINDNQIWETLYAPSQSINMDNKNMYRSQFYMRCAGDDAGASDVAYHGGNWLGSDTVACLSAVRCSTILKWEGCLNGWGSVQKINPEAAWVVVELNSRL